MGIGVSGTGFGLGLVLRTRLQTAQVAVKRDGMDMPTRSMKKVDTRLFAASSFFSSSSSHQSSFGSQIRVMQPITKAGNNTWEFPTLGDPSIVLLTIGSFLYGPQNKVPLIFGNPHLDVNAA